jgi:hypothetical protein
MIIQMIDYRQIMICRKFSHRSVDLFPGSDRCDAMICSRPAEKSHVRVIHARTHATQGGLSKLWIIARWIHGSILIDLSICFKDLSLSSERGGLTRKSFALHKYTDAKKLVPRYHILRTFSIRKVELTCDLCLFDGTNIFDGII